MEEVKTEEKVELDKEIMDALDNLEEVAINAIESKHKQWTKGFIVGSITALSGALSGLAIATLARTIITKKFIK